MNTPAMETRTDDLKSLLPYFLPYFLWVGFAYANKIHPEAVYVAYPLKTILVAILLICPRKQFPELKWNWSIHGVGVGIVALGLWLIPFWKLHPEIPAPNFEEGGFNPFQFEDNSLLMVSLIVFRISGATLVVPFIEELLFRSCIARLIVCYRENGDFRKVPIGTFTWASMWVTTLAFMVGHRQWEWIGALLVGFLYHGLVMWRKNILDCIVAHAVTNFGLGICVLVTKQWWW